MRVPEKLWTGLQSQVGWSVTTPALQRQVGGVMVAQQSPKLLVRVRFLAFLPNDVCSGLGDYRFKSHDNIWRVRLVVRTLVFHTRNASSILVPATKLDHSVMVSTKVFDTFGLGSNPSDPAIYIF